MGYQDLPSKLCSVGRCSILVNECKVIKRDGTKSWYSTQPSKPHTSAKKKKTLKTENKAPPTPAHSRRQDYPASIPGLAKKNNEWGWGLGKESCGDPLKNTEIQPSYHPCKMVSQQTFFGSKLKLTKRKQRPFQSLTLLQS